MKGEKLNQMKKLKPKNLERGITLISLIVTIIILIIVSAIVIKTITGDNSLIATTTEGAENYKVAEYKEMIAAQITATMQANMLKGEETVLRRNSRRFKRKHNMGKNS